MINVSGILHVRTLGRGPLEVTDQAYGGSGRSLPMWCSGRRGLASRAARAAPASGVVSREELPDELARIQLIDLFDAVL
jgi:hypothetical protein